MYPSNDSIHKYMKSKIELKGVKNKSTIIVEDYESVLSIVGRKTRKKTRKLKLNNTISRWESKEI